MILRPQLFFRPEGPGGRGPRGPRHAPAGASRRIGAFRHRRPSCGYPTRRWCRRVAPAVVNVYAAKTVAVSNPLFDDPVFRRFFGVPGGPGGQGGEQVQRSLGSGVLVDPAGLVVTNNHVIEGATR